MIYQVLKHMHVTCVVISIGGFFVRGLLMMRESPLLRQRWLKVVPHVNDSILLAAAIGLSVVTAQYPLVSPWVTAKIGGLIAYIVLGVVALTRGRSKRIRIAAWFSALAVAGYVVAVAVTKNAAGYLALI